MLENTEHGKHILCYLCFIEGFGFEQESCIWQKSKRRRLKIFLFFNQVYNFPKQGSISMLYHLILNTWMTQKCILSSVLFFNLLGYRLISLTMSESKHSWIVQYFVDGPLHRLKAKVQVLCRQSLCRGSQFQTSWPGQLSFKSTMSLTLHTLELRRLALRHWRALVLLE